MRRRCRNVSPLDSSRWPRSSALVPGGRRFHRRYECHLSSAYFAPHYLFTFWFFLLFFLKNAAERRTVAECQSQVRWFFFILIFSRLLSFSSVAFFPHSFVLLLVRHSTKHTHTHKTRYVNKTMPPCRPWSSCFAIYFAMHWTGQSWNRFDQRRTFAQGIMNDGLLVPFETQRETATLWNGWMLPSLIPRFKTEKKEGGVPSWWFLSQFAKDDAIFLIAIRKIK